MYVCYPNVHFKNVKTSSRTPQQTVMQSSWNRAGPALALVLLVASPMDAQEIQLKVTSATCHDCLNPQSGVLFGEDDGPGSLFTITQHHVIDSEGQHWIADNSSIQVFDANGNWIRRVGREGEGPGEFDDAFPLAALPGGGVLAFDRSQARASDFTADGRLGTTVRTLSEVQWASVLESGALILNRVYVDEDAPGRILWVVKPGQSLDRPTAMEPVEINRFRPWDTTRLLAPSTKSPDQFWAAVKNRYHVELWDVSTGRRTAVFTRDVDWFPDVVVEAGGNQVSPSKPPPASLESVYQDTNGLVWLAVSVPAPDFAAHLREEVYGDRTVWVPDNPSNLWVSMVEVFDPASGEIVYSQRFDRRIIKILGGHPVAVSFPEIDPSGVESIRVVLFTTHQ